MAIVFTMPAESLSAGMIKTGFTMAPAARIGRTEGARFYDAAGKSLGRVDDDRFYDAAGKYIGRVDGNRLYDGSGRQIARADGLQQRYILIFFYFFM
jgi:hypothetical protein